MIQKVAVAVEVLFLERAASDHFVGEFPLQIHEKLQHLIVGLAGEQDPARVEFVDGARGAPHIDGVVVGHAQDDLGGAVEARHQVGSDFVLVDLRGRSEIAQFQYQFAVVDQDVIRFDI